MPFMIPTTYTGPYTVATTRHGETYIVPDGHYPIGALETEDAVSVEHKDGLIWHLSAAGYMDQTDWMEAADETEAREDCESMYDVCFDCGEDFDEHGLCPGCAPVMDEDDREDLIAMGFSIRDERYMYCDSCAAATVNGVAVHERGCRRQNYACIECETGRTARRGGVCDGCQETV